MKKLFQPILLLTTILLLVISGCGSILSAQQDSTKQFSLQELKQLSGLLPELQKRREQKETFIEKELYYKNYINDCNENQKLYEQELANKNAEIEAIKPPWYDHFWVGGAVIGLAVSSIYFLAR